MLSYMYVASERNVTQREQACYCFFSSSPSELHTRAGVVMGSQADVTLLPDVSVVTQDVCKVTDYCFFVHYFCVISSNVLLQIRQV